MSKRIQIVIPDHVYQALLATAAARETKPSTIAGAIVIQAADISTQTPLERAQPDLSDRGDRQPFLEKRSPPEPLVSGNDASAEPDEDPSNQRERAGWLQHDRGEEWRDAMWNAAERLHASFPELHDTMRSGWHNDRFTRNGIFALAVWRQQIDEHAPNDPRLELQWLAALADFARSHEQHRRQIRHRDERLPRPHDW